MTYRPEENLKLEQEVEKDLREKVLRHADAIDERVEELQRLVKELRAEEEERRNGLGQ